METKRCTKCGNVKFITEFNKSIRGKYGVVSWCKKCSSERCKTYYQNNKDRVKECQRKYRQVNREKLRKKTKEYYWANAKEVNKRGTAYQNNRRKYDFVFKLNRNMSNAITSALR